MKKMVKVFLVALLVFVILIAFVLILWIDDEPSTPEIFVGVEFAYGNVDECKDLVDKVKNYTNLFVLGLPELTFNRTELSEVCDYIYAAGLNFIVMFTNPLDYANHPIDERDYHPYVWIKKAAEKYGEKFLGIYYYDEPGGKQLDGNEGRMVVAAEDYSEAANIYIDYLRAHIEYYLYSGVKVFTSDYGLYWFNYKAGYDAVLVQLGWNLSRPLHIALCRGAANVQNKDWGVIVTWTFTHPPYIESGDELYNDLVLAYKAGAKYFVVFSYPNITGYGTLTEEHFEALEKFWNYIHENPAEHGIYKGEVGYVVPKDFGFGFRGYNDTVWGLWDSDEFAAKIMRDSLKLVAEHQFKLDIIYDENEISDVIKGHYEKLIFWNEEC